MIAKIMSEASRSIIGMLSAKPADMETRTANIEFSSLLLSGENRSRPAVEIVADAGKENGVKNGTEKGSGNSAENDVEQFLSQLIGHDDAPVLPVNDRDIAKAIGINAPAKPSEGEAELSSDDAVNPEVARFIATVQPLLGERPGDGNETPPKTGLALNLPKRATGHSGPIADTQIDQKPPVRTDGQAPAAADKQFPSLPAAQDAKDVVTGDTKNAAQDVNKSPVAAKPYSDAQTGDKSKDNGFGKAHLAPAGSQDTNSERPVSEQKVQDLLDFRLAAKDKSEASKARQVLEPKGRETAIAAATKPVKADTGSFSADMDNLPAAGHLDRNAELPAAAPASPAAAAHNSTSKTVNFDWNAPQFSERFAAELAELTVTGDHKKFEINPKNMGRLELSFLSRGSAEIVRIETENDAAREMIVQHSQAIQDLLKASGRSDLTLRVDVRENMFAASDNGGMNFNQQDSTSEREEGFAQSGHSGTASLVERESDAGPQDNSDNSRYA